MQADIGLQAYPWFYNGNLQLQDIWFTDRYVKYRNRSRYATTFSLYVYHTMLNRVMSQLNHKIQKNVTIYITACLISTPKMMRSLYFSKSKIFYCCNQSADSIPALMIMLHSLQSDMFAPFKDYNLNAFFTKMFYTKCHQKQKNKKSKRR